MPSNSTLSADFYAAVAAEFADRPTLRQLAGHKALEILATHYPVVAAAQLPDGGPLVLQIPDDNSHMATPYQSWTPRSLVDVLLEAMLASRSLQSMAPAGGEFLVSVTAPHYLRDAEGNKLEHATVSVNKALGELDELRQLLAEFFCQAQLDYWAAVGSQGVSRDCWLQQVLKSTLLQNLPLQGLDAQERFCIQGLLKGGKEQPQVFVVQVQLERYGLSFAQTLSNLLISAELDERQLVVWVAPSGVVRAFESLDDFTLALRETLGAMLSFDSMTWHRYEVEGDIFAHQTALLVDAMFQPFVRADYQRCVDVAAMEQLFAALSDPSAWFIKGYVPIADSSVQIPPGLVRTGPNDSFAFQCGLFDLALAQLESAGVAALDGVADLHSYTRNRLRAQLLSDYPTEANYFPDDLNLTLTTVAGAAGGAGAGVGDSSIETRTETLSDFAIGNLSSLGGARVTAITHREEQLIMPWMTPAYVQSLVQRVDIGGNYPAYVAQMLDDPMTKPQRVTRFAREWRCSLLFSALRARLNETLSEAGLQVVASYCRYQLDEMQPSMQLMPLAFTPDAQGSDYDLVRGMYVLFSTQPATVILFRPLYPTQAVLEFASIEAMLASIRASESLQQSMLEWMLPQARPIYDLGGFSEPHWNRPIIDPGLLPEAPKPPTFAPRLWSTDVDRKLYESNRELLVELADRQSVSNQESRWAVLSEGAWLLFQVVSLPLKGPIAVFAWMVQLLTALSNDIDALQKGSRSERSAAAVDLILNTAMLLLHARLPAKNIPDVVPLPHPTTFDGLPVQAPQGSNSTTVVRQGETFLPSALAAQGQLQLDLSWRGRQGFNMLTTEQREALLAMRTDVSVNGHEPLAAGDTQGLYLIAGHHYVSLAGDVYLLSLADGQVRIADPSGRPGPWIVRKYGVWRIDNGLRLRGGMPKSRVQRLREENQKRMVALRAEEAQIISKSEPIRETFNRHRDQLIENQLQIEALQALPEPNDVEKDKLNLLLGLQRRINERVVAELKQVIDNNLEHDNILSALNQMSFMEPGFVDVLTQQRSYVRQSFLEYAEAYFNEVAKILNEENVDKLKDRIAVLPETEAEKQEYKHFVAILEKVQGWGANLIEVSSHMDNLLEDTLKDQSIFFKDERGEKVNRDSVLKKMIKLRQLNAVDLEFHLLEDLAELSLDRLQGTDEQVLQEYEGYLDGPALRSAGAAHGELAGSELTLAERIEILNGVLDSYEEAACMADYLASLGGPVIRSEKLKLYRASLKKLQDSARKEMSSAVREQELAEPRPVRTYSQHSRGGKRRVVLTQKGRSVLGEELEVDGASVIQQKDSQGKVLKTFNPQGMEEVAPARDPLTPTSPSTPDKMSSVRKRARKLLDEINSVVDLARRYSNSKEPLGLTTVMEQHTQKLQEVMAVIARTSLDAALYEELRGGIQRLELNQRDLLKSLYLTTNHPSANGLKYLFQQRQVSIARSVSRRKLAAQDYLDVYEIRRFPELGQDRGMGLWEAHFHYPSENADDRSFVQGHLKIWAQRKLGHEAQMRAAQNNDVLDIYRGKLRLADVEGIIPFE